MKLTNLVTCCVVLVLTAGLAFSQGRTSAEYLADGSRFYLAHDYAHAIPPYVKALELEKKERHLSKELWFVLIDNLSMAYAVSGNLNASTAVIEYGISKEPEYPMFYFILACNYGEVDDEVKALENLRLSFKYKENRIKGEAFPDPETDSSFARLMKRESFRKAVAELKNGGPTARAADDTWGCGALDYKCQLDGRIKALNADPKNPENYYNVAMVHLRSGNPTLAVQTLDLYLAIPGVDPLGRADGFNSRGIAYKQLKRYDLANADYTKAIELNPKCADCLNNRGNIGPELKRPDQGMEDYNRAIAVDPKYALAYANRGHLLAAQGKNDEALKDLSVAIELDPAYAEAYYTRAMVYREKRNFAAAIPDLTDYIGRVAGNDKYLADAYVNRAIAYVMNGDPAKAEKDVTRAIGLAPDYVDAYRVRTLIYRDANKIAEAEADEKKAGELSAKPPN